MPLQRQSSPRWATSRRPTPMMGSMVRSLALLVPLALAIAACSSPGASSSWSYGPTLEPAASGSAAASASAPASAPASVAPSASSTASASPSAPASAGPSASPAGDATALTIGTRSGTETEFEPDEVSTPAGGTIRVAFENSSSLPHNLTFNAPINAATEPVVDPGASETIEFPAPEPGDYTFVCTIHPGMEGTLTVEAGS